MNFQGWTLEDVAAYVTAALDAANIPAVVVGGSAVTLHAPTAYTSFDIDFATPRGATRREFGRAVAPLGFEARGRDFVNPTAAYTLDHVADTPYVDQREIVDFHEIRTKLGTLRVLKFSDAIADRIAAFVHWADTESLDVAERAVLAYRGRESWSSLEKALIGLDVGDTASVHRAQTALRRLRAARRGR